MSFAHHYHCVAGQEALLPRRDVPVKIFQLLHNSVETTTTSPEQIEVMDLKGYSRPTQNKLVHSDKTRSIDRHRCNPQAGRRRVC